MKKTIRYVLSGVLAAAVLTLASCSDDDKTLPAIEGYNNADEVAADNLLAHWTFDDTNSETISGTAPSTTTGASFIGGIKGKALSLDEGFLVYPTITKLSAANAFPSVTVSLWVNVANNGTAQTNVFGITQSTSVQSDWNTGPLNVYVETGNNPVTYDTLQIHSNFATYINEEVYRGDNVNNYGVKGTDYQVIKTSGKWFHYIMRYDGSSSNIDLYADGVKVSNNKFAHRTYSPDGVETGLGNIVATPPTQVVIGSWANATAGFTNSAAQTWQGLMTGSVDEIRVFNKALTDKEIGALYQLELAGR